MSGNKLIEIVKKNCLYAPLSRNSLKTVWALININN